nr:MAG TPA: hypothetical protein [Caudoviricetes sp.]
MKWFRSARRGAVRDHGPDVRHAGGHNRQQGPVRHLARLCVSAPGHGARGLVRGGYGRPSPLRRARHDHCRVEHPALGGLMLPLYVVTMIVATVVLAWSAVEHDR